MLFQCIGGVFKLLNYLTPHRLPPPPPTLLLVSPEESSKANIFARVTKEVFIDFSMNHINQRMETGMEVVPFFASDNRDKDGMPAGLWICWDVD